VQFGELTGEHPLGRRGGAGSALLVVLVDEATRASGG
jgi:hypothetical protein